MEKNISLSTNTRGMLRCLSTVYTMYVEQQVVFKQILDIISEKTESLNTGGQFKTNNPLPCIVLRNYYEYDIQTVTVCNLLSSNKFSETVFKG